MTEMEKAVLAFLMVHELLKAEKKILAIKMVRFMYNANLADGKALVDMIERARKEIKC
jgi:ribosomal protein L7/L12